MIIEIPTADDFTQYGTAYLNLAWGTTIELALVLDEAEMAEWDTTGEVTDEYWTSAQRPLATAVSLLQQGAEFLLKSHIAAVSPFLLIALNPSDWPKGCHSVDKPFSDFKTIDAKDLVRVHDTIAGSRLSPQFVSTFESLRRQRNSIMHTVDRRTRFTAGNVITSILEIADEFLGNRRWVACRRSFLEVDHTSVAHSGDHVDRLVVREFQKVVELLHPAATKRFFGFNKRQRRYVCYHCYSACIDWGLQCTTAQLQPNTPTSTCLSCFVCGQTTNVERRSCDEEGCESNVISTEDGTCLTCLR